MKRIGKRYKPESKRIGFDMSSTIGDIAADLELYYHDIEIALPETVNTALDELRDELITGITAAYNVSQRRVRSSISVRRAKKGAPRGVVGVSGGHIPLYEFSPDPRTRYKRLAERPSVGVSALIGRSEARTMFSGSFISDMPSRGIGVYKRVGRYAGQVTRLSGPSVPQMAMVVAGGADLEDHAHRRFYENLRNTLTLGHQARAGFGR